MVKKPILTNEKKKLPWNFILLVFLNIVVVVVFVIYVLNLQYNIFSPISDQAPEIVKPTVHYYENKDVSLEKILVRVFLFQPNNSDVRLGDDWREEFKNIFDKIQAVHQKQFFNLSAMEYVVYPEIITGKQSAQYYDSDMLIINLGEDTEQLNLIIDEINDRIENAELNKINYDDFDYTYLVNQVFYTGSNKSNINGTVGGYTNEIDNINTSLIFWMALMDNRSSQNASVVYHEILHTFGVPEGYYYNELSPFAPRVDDIMGAGVYEPRPIEVNYLMKEVKKKMGL